MPIIAFWSNRKKETAQTLSMIAIATHMAVENNSKILIVDTNLNDKTVERAFWPVGQTLNQQVTSQLGGGKIDIGSGIEGLSKLIASGRDAGNLITDYAKVVFKGRLEIIPSFIPKTQEDIPRIIGTYRELVRMANQQYDYVFVDLPKGTDTDWVNQILDISNVIVLNMTQRMSDMDDYIKLKENNQLFSKNNILPLIGRYDKYSKYSKRNIARYIGEKRDIPAVSYNTLFFESANEGEIGTYFLKFRKSLISSQDRNAVFVNEVTSAAERLVLKVQEVAMMR